LGFVRRRYGWATFWPANSDCFLAIGIDRLTGREWTKAGSTWFQLGSAIRARWLAAESDWFADRTRHALDSGC
jgi:hypothetical protein